MSVEKEYLKLKRENRDFRLKISAIKEIVNDREPYAQLQMMRRILTDEELKND